MCVGQASHSSATRIPDAVAEASGQDLHMLTQSWLNVLYQDVHFSICTQNAN